MDLSQFTPLEIILLGVIITYLGVRGVLMLPWVKPKRKGTVHVLDTKEALRVHQGCNNFFTLKPIIDKTIRDAERIMEIKFHDTLFAQMNEFDVFFSQERDLFTKVYVELLKQKGVKNVYINAEYKSFCYLVDCLEDHLKKIIRGYMKRNHLADKNEEEFREYTKIIAEKIISESRRFFDNYFPLVDTVVSREELRQYNEKKILDASMDIIIKFMYKVRAIAIEAEKQITRLRSGIDDTWTSD